MSTSEIYEDSVQIVKNHIDSELMDEAMAELKLEMTPATNEITTRITWTPTCERLREYFVMNVHPKVYLETTGHRNFADSM